MVERSQRKHVGATTPSEQGPWRLPEFSHSCHIISARGPAIFVVTDAQHIEEFSSNFSKGFSASISQSQSEAIFSRRILPEIGCEVTGQSVTVSEPFLAGSPAAKLGHWRAVKGPPFLGVKRTAIREALT